MAPQAKVTSLEALETLRSSLIVFKAKARRALEEAQAEGVQMRQWLQSDQRTRWEQEIRARAKKLEQAEQELMTARLSGHREALLARQAAVQKLQQAQAEAQAKLRAVKQWAIRYDNTADPVFRRLEELRHFLESDLPQATAFLANARKALEAYAEPGAPGRGSSTPAAGTEPASPQP